jgi:hypothetical protein
MRRERNGRLALLVLGVICLLPVGTFAGPPASCPSVPAQFGPPPSYSPCHYRTPVLYRLWAEHYYGVRAGSCGPSCAGPAPSSPANEQTASPATTAPDTKDRQQGQ